VNLLGLDFGRRRIGVAVSHGVVAGSLTTLNFDEQNFADFVQKIKEIAQAQRADKIIVGLPLGFRKAATTQSDWTKKQSEKLAKDTGFNVEFVEESFSSTEARDQVASFAMSKKNKAKKGLIDQESARIILQQYLNENSDPSLQAN